MEMRQDAGLIVDGQSNRKRNTHSGSLTSD
jgi:hypothetical protein